MPNMQQVVQSNKTGLISQRKYFKVIVLQSPGFKIKLLIVRNISNEQMATRASVSNGLLKRFESTGDDFLLRFVTADETGSVTMNQKTKLKIGSR